MTGIEVLRKMKELLSTSDKWIQGDYEKIVDGESCYCIYGALYRAAGYDGNLTDVGAPAYYFASAGYLSAISLLREVVGSQHLDVWNDCPGRTYEDVMNVLTVAIGIYNEGN